MRARKFARGHGKEEEEAGRASWHVVIHPMMDSGSALVVLTLLLSGGVTAALHSRSRQRREERTRRLARERVGTGPPRSLYPVVDVDRCIGSLSCLHACPEGEVLGVRDGIPTLLHPERCLGHGVCADACPVGAIRLVLGTRESAVFLPQLGPGFESSRKGIHVVGELAGAPLLGPSIAQGLHVGELLAAELRCRAAPADPDVSEVAIVGGGPAGIAVAFALAAAGRTYRVLERGAALTTIRSYPRGKEVLTEPVSLPGVGRFGARRLSREQLLDEWSEAIERGRVRVEDGIEASGVEGSDGEFTVRTTRGPIRARKVVLAAGRGAPRRLGVPGAELPKVTAHLDDPGAYRQRRVLVVGGGDSAAEAAAQIARAGAREVTLCHRGDALTRCRAENAREVDELASAGLLKVRLRTRLVAIEERRVCLATDQGEISVENDHVVMALGQDLNTELLQGAGVRMKRYVEESPATGWSHRARRRSIAIGRVALAVAVMAGPAVLFLALDHGWTYYRLDRVARIRSPLHPTLRSAGALGISTGIAAALLVAMALVYTLRKRSRWLLRFGPMPAWLDLHVAAGVGCLFVVGVHAAFAASSAVASATWLSLAGIVATGVLGMHLHGALEPTAAATSAWRRRLLFFRPHGPGGALPGSVEIEAGRAMASPALRRMRGAWRVLHLALAAFFLLAVAAHVAFVVFLGYASV